MEKPTYLSHLQVTMKYCSALDNIISDTCWVEYKTNNPIKNLESPSPFLTYSQINKQYLEINLTHPDNCNISLAIFSK